MRTIHAVACFCAVVFLSCSHYSTSGRLPEHIRTVYIPTFENETAEFYIPQLITDEVTDRFLSEANLRLGDATGADAALTGSVVRYYEEAETFGGTGSTDVSGRRVTVVLRVEFTDRVEGKTLWESSNFSRWVVYEPDRESEREAAERAVNLLADDMISSVLQQW
jgi:Lipopolysaccharide-assembly